MSFVLQPIDPRTADRLRPSATHVVIADAHPGYPCRQCLRDAQIGEELVLVSYDPFLRDSPYRAASPIYLHRIACSEPPSRTVVAEQQTRRLLAVRAYDTGEMMLDAEVIPGSDLAGALDRLLADPRTAIVRVHNAPQGCWAVDAVRS